MMSILPALGALLSGVVRRGMAVISDTASSDMDSLSDQREIQGEGGAFARAALHADVARVFLDDAVGDRKSKTRAAILALRGGRLGSEKWIVDALNVFLGDPGASIRDAHADDFAIQRIYDPFFPTKTSPAE